MDGDQTAMQAALDAAHRARDLRNAQAYVRRRAAKNRKPVIDPFAQQLGLPSDWRADFHQERADKLKRRQQRKDERRVNERRLHRQMLDEMRMARWRSATGAGLRDW